MQQHCEDHVRMERELAGTIGAVCSLREADSQTARAVERLDDRLRGIEAKAARYAGALAAIAALPVMIRLGEMLISVARAAMAG